MPWVTNSEKRPLVFTSFHGTIKVSPGETKWCPRNSEPRNPPGPPPNNSGFLNMSIEVVEI